MGQPILLRFKDSELFKKCQELGIIPRSEEDTRRKGKDPGIDGEERFSLQRRKTASVEPQGEWDVVSCLRLGHRRIPEEKTRDFQCAVQLFFGSHEV